MNVAVLASGSGTNLQALIDSARRGELGPARLVVVGANVPDCRALARAHAAGLPTFVVDHRTFATREDFDRALEAALARHNVDLVVLAGFMRLLGAAFLTRYHGRIINIHPALLPAFPGLHGQKQAFAYGVKVSGCTVHFVDSGVDSGPVIAQTAVPVLDDDDEPTLSARILAEEHRLLPAAVRALAEGRVTTEGRRVRIQGAHPSAEALRGM
jgi:phosphoribosylglycinamide formyltransferase-1